MPRFEPYRVTVAVLAGLAAVLFAYPVVRIGLDLEIDYNEGWSVYQQLRAMTGESPYSGEGPLFFNNYPPLSFYLVGLLGRVSGDTLLTGRLLSVLAMAVIALCSGVVVRAGGGGRADAILAVSTCLALFCSFATDYVGVNDPQLLAQGFLCAGFALYVGGPPTPARLAAVAALFAAGLLTKHNVLVLPLVVTVHVLWRVPGKARWSYLLTGTTLAGAATAVIWVMFGADFFRQLLSPRIYDVGRGVLLTVEVLGRLQAPLTLAVLFLILRRNGAVGGQVAAYLAGGLVLGIGFAGGAGVDVNIFFDAMVAIAIAIGLAAAWLRRQPALPRVAPAILALLANAGVILFTPEALGRFAVDALGEFELRQRLFRDDVAYLRGIPGPVVCESMLLCQRAGKPMWVDPYNVVQATLTGRLPRDVLVGALARHEAAVVQISSQREHPRDEAPGVQTMPQRFINFSDDIFDEIERSYALDRVGLSGRFYRPRPF